ncbi:unnamed protein product [Kuraishia capsulata CBS 1993]|uniref:tryptophan--tRNA ligase n=1 Tax=Kuraishia capsulata CBS 1993 TaxID=1382522 RepID=W6ML81_9ASCO|nr:uncharacterized protein KUCA_T00001497001 [Kuraishia capsulata CBS 1993]CDK25527.1 unnamed protein product [Kuraishia capsulata CBS 1993]
MLRCLRRSYSSAASVELIASVRDPKFRIPGDATIFSGIQPTGIFHLGNYLGATRVWSDLTERISEEKLNSEPMFMVADLHSITVPQIASDLRTMRKQALASIIACGVDPAKARLFYQSTVPEHSELNWVISCSTPVGMLNRMTQWKSKANLSSGASLADDASLGGVKLGLLAYPTLMAADVLLYRSTHVPVGADQAQHLELTRELAIKTNKLLRTDYFPVPKTLLAPTNKILSLKNPLKKMSKSDPEPLSKIFITDSDKDIKTKINKAITDSIDGKITYNPIERPGIANLLTIISAIERRPVSQILNDVENFEKRELKALVVERLTTEIKGPRERFSELMKNDALLNRISKEGTEKAREVASKTIKDVYELMGLN